MKNILDIANLRLAQLRQPMAKGNSECLFCEKDFYETKNDICNECRNIKRNRKPSLVSTDGVTCCMYDENGFFCEWCEKDNIKIGCYREWWDNNQKYRECFYKDGVFHGMYKMWYKNGKLYEKRKYHNGKVKGLSKTWYPNGKKRSEYDDKSITEWYENGNKKFTYKDGVFTQWYPNGKKDFIHDHNTNKFKYK